MSIQFWQRWLMMVTVGVIIYSLCLILFPITMLELFNKLFFPSMDVNRDFSVESKAYITFTQGVLGAVIIGWMITILSMLRYPFGQQQWNTLTLSISMWFVIDSGYSLYAGVAAHAVFNVVFLMLFAIPLGAIHSHKGR